MKNPLVSVIVPNYNHEAFLEQRIESIVNQDYKNLEIHILDDCSIDNSLSVIQKYAVQDNRISVIINHTNSGNTFRQWEKGISQINGELVWIAESDDWADTRFVSEIVPLFDDKKVGVCFCKSNLVDVDNKIIGTTSDLTEGKNIPSMVKVDGKSMLKHYHAYFNLIPNASAAIFRKDLASFDFLDQKIAPRLIGDKFFWHNVMSKSNVIYIDKPLNNFRTHKDNVRSSVSDLEVLEENLRFWLFLKNSIFGDSLPKEIIQKVTGWWGRLILRGDIKFFDSGFNRILSASAKLDRLIPLHLLIFLAKTRIKHAR